MSLGPAKVSGRSLEGWLKLSYREYNSISHGIAYMGESTEAGADSAEEGGVDAKLMWESFDATVYESTAQGLVHHSFKSVNSNASGGGVRLSSDSALRLPYVSARTLMACGVALDLDYTANTGKVARVVKQMRAVARNTPLGSLAPEDERAVINRVLGNLGASQFETGTDHVDLRMRQILLPRGGGDYVSFTPVSASGLSSLLFDIDAGLVTMHNQRAAEEAKQSSRDREKDRERPRLRRIRRAQLGIGGSNPQNVGALVRTMQRPLFVPGPSGAHSLRAAFAIYYRGIELPFARDLVDQYNTQRASLHDGSQRGTRAEAREAEEMWIRRVAAYYHAVGTEALEVLLAFESALPKEHLLAGTLQGAHELVSRAVSPSIRGLIDPRLRGEVWYSHAARDVIERLTQERRTVEGESVAILVLDGAARVKLATLLEGALR
jgi:hypothetical protein